MNWDEIEGQWKQRRGKAMLHWGKIMNDELAAIAGKYEGVVGKLQEKYGAAKEASRKQDIEFKRTVTELKKANRDLARLQKIIQKTTREHRATTKSARGKKSGKRR